MDAASVEGIKTQEAKPSPIWFDIHPFTPLVARFLCAAECIALLGASKQLRRLERDNHAWQWLYAELGVQELGRHWDIVEWVRSRGHSPWRLCQEWRCWHGFNVTFALPAYVATLLMAGRAVQDDCDDDLRRSGNRRQLSFAALLMNSDSMLVSIKVECCYRKLFMKDMAANARDDSEDSSDDYEEVLHVSQIKPLGMIK